jgi:uncharacterized protein (DUF58 family)
VLLLSIGDWWGAVLLLPVGLSFVVGVRVLRKLRRIEGNGVSATFYSRKLEEPARNKADGAAIARRQAPPATRRRSGEPDVRLAEAPVAAVAD